MVSIRTYEGWWDVYSQQPERRGRALLSGSGRGDRRLGDGLYARDHLSSRPNRKNFFGLGGPLDALVALNCQFAHMLAVNYQTVSDDFGWEFAAPVLDGGAAPQSSHDKHSRDAGVWWSARSIAPTQGASTHSCQTRAVRR